MDTQKSDLHALALHLDLRNSAILEAWRGKVRGDPALASGNALPRFELDDHIPALLSAYADRLREVSGAPHARHAAGAHMLTRDESKEAAAHGSHRWQQGYDLHEVTRELGRLNELMTVELDAYAQSRPLSHSAAALARKMWAESHTQYAEESTTQYFLLQRTEAAGHVRDLEQALQAVHELERQRAELWRQIAHDLRGNIGVVANAASGLQHENVPADSRAKLLHMLERNVGTLKHFLDDVTELARLHAGQEHLRAARLDAAPLLAELCEGLQAYARERKLYLRTRGPATLPVEADAGKLRRIAQNLIINALKYTSTGGVTVSWEGGGSADPARWAFCVEDTGPGMHRGPITQVLEDVTAGEAAPAQRTGPPPTAATGTQHSGPPNAGEGIGLSIVKRLAELLNATIEIESEPGMGTQFRVRLPQRYSR